MKKFLVLFLLILLLNLSACNKEKIEKEENPSIDENEEIIEVVKPKDEIILKVEEFLDKIHQSEISQIAFSGYNNINQSYSRINFITLDDIIIDQQFVDKKYKETRPGIIRNSIDWIVIHDTGNNTASANGLKHANYITKNNPGVSWHYTIDEEKIYQHIPDNEVAYHAGDGLRPTGTKWYSTTYNKTNYGGGNYNGIGIETCVYNGIDYLETIVTTAKLVAKLCYTYNLSIDSVKRHYDFSGKQCPSAIIKSNYYDDLITLISYYLEAYTLFYGIEIEYICDSYLKEYITKDGVISNKIQNNTIIEYKVKVLYKNKEYIYFYETKIKKS